MPTQSWGRIADLTDIEKTVIENEDKALKVIKNK